MLTPSEVKNLQDEMRERGWLLERAEIAFDVNITEPPVGPAVEGHSCWTGTLSFVRVVFEAKEVTVFPIEKLSEIVEDDCIRISAVPKTDTTMRATGPNAWRSIQKVELVGTFGRLTG